MGDKPIIFSGPMVRAILREIEAPGTGKTQTRRVLRPQPSKLNGGLPLNNGHGSYSTSNGWKRYPIVVGDRLWVREATTRFDRGSCDQWVWYRSGRNDMGGMIQRNSWFSEQFPDHPTDGDWARASGPASGAPYNVPSIHMPRCDSRITLTVTDVRVQRLRDISEEDARAEGINGNSGGPWGCEGLIEDFADLWDGINAKRGHCWDSNPWVAAYTFTPKLGNIDHG